VDFDTQTIEYVSAGAPPQLYRSSSEDQFEVISQSSLPLGILPDVAYDSRTVAFRPGGELVLFTDGLVETPKPPRNLFTTVSLREFLNKTKPGASLQLCNLLLDQLSKQAIKADDDITLVIAKHTGGVDDGGSPPRRSLPPAIPSRPPALQTKASNVHCWPIAPAGCDFASRRHSDPKARIAD
jgi:hypothetical protein